MTNSRFQELYRVQPKLYLEGSPVLIEVGVLQKDTISNRVLTQIKLCNLSDKCIVACKVNVRAFEANGSELSGVTGFSYLDLNAGTGQNFGSKTPIYMPDNATRHIDISVVEVVFKDNSIWTAEPVQWSQIPTQKAIAEVFHDPEMIKQIEIDAGSSAAFCLKETSGLYLCTCGTANLKTADRCYMCGREYSALVQIFDENSLLSNRDERLKKEQEAKEASERAAIEAAEAARIKKESIKARFRKLTKIAAVVVALAVATYGIIFHLVPLIQYNKAALCLEEEDYAQAYNRFVALGEYKDSPDKVALCKKGMSYLDAKALFEAANYKVAAESFSALSDYLDSADLANASYYMYAQELLERGEYEEAYTVFKSLSNYEQSKDLMDESYYRLALQRFNEKQYAEAHSIFAELSSYKDSKDYATESEYFFAIERFDSEDYATAVTAFKEVVDYKDTAERLPEAMYLYATELNNKSDWKTAYILFEELGNYKDCKSQLKAVSAHLEMMDIWDGIYDYSRYETNANDANTLSWIKDLLPLYGDSLTISYAKKQMLLSSALLNNVTFTKTYAKWTEYDEKTGALFPGCKRTKDGAVITIGSVRFYYLKRE